MKKYFAKVDPGYLLAALLPIIGIIPTIGSGIIKTADGPLHVQRIYAMSLMLGQGDLWPRWIPYFHLGYGYPIFNYYPPGVFHLGGFLVLLGLSATAAFTVISALAWVVGSIGTYGLARSFLPGRGAILSAMIWAYAPSRLFEIWNQGSLPQMMAAALIPSLFWGMVKVAESPTRHKLLAIALPLVGIILTHQPMTVIAALFIVPSALILPLWSARRARQMTGKRLIYMAGGLMLGVGLAAIFLLPIAAELRYVAASQTPSDAANYLRNNFLQPSQLFMQPAIIDLRDLRFDMPPTMGIIGVILAAAGLLALVVKRRFGLALMLVAGFAFSVFMLLPVSLPLWKSIPYLIQLRFPERFLRIGVIFVAIAGGASILLLPRRWQGVGLGCAMTAVLVAALPTIYANRPFINWDKLSALTLINMEIDDHIWGTTSYNEFNPVWGDRIAFDHPPDLETYLDDPLTIRLWQTDIQQADRSFQRNSGDTVSIDSPEAGALRFRQYYFPGWTAMLDGKPIPVYAEQAFGLLTVDLPAGQHTIQVQYEGTSIQKVGTLISLVSVGITLLIAVYPTTLHEKLSVQKSLGYRPTRVIAAAVIAFAFVNTVYIAPHTLWFRYQSPPDDPVYMKSKTAVPFGGLFQLEGYTLNQDRVTPGETLNVILFWRPLSKIDREYRPIVQFVNLSTSISWAVSEPFSPGGGKTSSYPVNRFSSDNHMLQIPASTPPFVGRMLVAMVDVQTGERLRLPDGSDHLLLEPIIRVRGSGPTAKQLMSYNVGGAIELWCASVTADDAEYHIELYWHVMQPVDQNYTLFVHGLGSENQILEQNDAVPLNGDYPTSLWLPGQTLVDSYTLPRNPHISQIAVGLYRDSEPRLAVTQDGQRVADDRVLLPIAPNACQSN
jgi:6-pyruvoyl-tetrahydropterin synthase related domain